MQAPVQVPPAKANTKWRTYPARTVKYTNQRVPNRYRYKRSSPSPAPNSEHPRHLHARDSAQNVLKAHILAVLGELVGSIFFFSSQLGGVSAATSNVARREGVSFDQASEYFTNNDYIYMACSNGLAALVLVWICFRVSGAFFSPAISLANYLVGGCGAIRAILLAVASTVGGIIATAINYGMIPGDYVPTIQLSNGTSLVQGLFMEMLATTLLIFTALYSFRQRTKATYLSPILIGLCIFMNILFLAPFTGAAMNPIRAFGPAVISGSFNPDQWVYWAGPCLGAILGAFLYRSVNYLHKALPSGNEENDQSKEEQQAIRIGRERERHEHEQQEKTKSEQQQRNKQSSNEQNEQNSVAEEITSQIQHRISQIIPRRTAGDSPHDSPHDSEHEHEHTEGQERDELPEGRDGSDSVWREQSNRQQERERIENTV